MTIINDNMDLYMRVSTQNNLLIYTLSRPYSIASDYTSAKDYMRCRQSSGDHPLRRIIFCITVASSPLYATAYIAHSNP